MTLSQALSWTDRLIALAVFLQTIEFLQIRRTFDRDGIWTWSVLRDDFSHLPSVFRFLLKIVFNDRRFFAVLILQLLCSVMLFLTSSAAASFLLLLTALLIAIRWRGTFNGGSDSMTILILAAISVAHSTDQEKIAKGALLYLAIQASLSYFIAGLVKLRKPAWRSGKALFHFLRDTNYEVPDSLRRWNSPAFVLFCSWGILAFECFFPLALFSDKAAFSFAVAGGAFHLLNAYILGLNRFLFAWIASYPALIYCAGLRFL
jgi:hypothetical protein